MHTLEQIEEQIELERDQISQGLKRLRENTKQLEGKNYSSATIYGITSIDMLLPLVIERIKTTNSRIRRGQAGKSFKEIQHYLFDLEPLAAAAIACKVTFDQVFGYKDNSNTLANVCTTIGAAIEHECQMRHYEDKAPALLHTLKQNYWHKSIGTHQKIVVIQTLMNRYNVERWKTWDNTSRVKLGGWLLDCIMEVSGWFYKDTVYSSRRKQNLIKPTPEFIQIKDEIMAESELFAPLAWPMLIKPNDWGEKPGGYLLNEVMRGHSMVRHANPTIIQGKTPIDFLNKIQKVSYRLNPFIVNMAKMLYKQGIAVGKFIPIVEMPLPPKPPDIAENAESRKKYRRDAAVVMNENAGSFRRSCRTRMTMETIKRFEGKDYWIPWSFDYRGRAYPIPAFLTPQDTDFGKACIKFAEESVITEKAEHWLAFQVATTYGLDKATIEERLEWVKSNTDLIVKIANNPRLHLPDWEAAEEPWQFLAAVDEFYHCILIKDRKTTGLPVAVDATCSGLQILALLARDKKTAQLVNVLPTERPQDAYAVVAEKAKPNIPKHLHKHWDRKAVKRVVMTIPYNAKPYSNRAYIRDALKEKGVEIDKDDLTLTVQAVRDAMSSTVPGPMNVMNWIEKEVSKSIGRGMSELVWVTPSGFTVNQRIMKKHVERIELKLLGRCQVHIATDDTDKVDTQRHKAATAPNLIHSLDASLLHLAIQRFHSPIALIHDSVLCRATDMSILSNIVREVYMELSKQNYLQDFAYQIEAETEPPIIGDLEASTVIDSTYFFC